MWSMLFPLRTAFHHLAADRYVLSSETSFKFEKNLKRRARLPGGASSSYLANPLGQSKGDARGGEKTPCRSISLAGWLVLFRLSLARSKARRVRGGGRKKRLTIMNSVAQAHTYSSTDDDTHTITAEKKGVGLILAPAALAIQEHTANSFFTCRWI